MRVKKISNHYKSITSLIASKLSHDTVAIGYYKYLNFGDLLTPPVFQYFGLKVLHCPVFRYSSAIGVGSLLHKVPNNYSGYILGSGLIKNEKRNLDNAKKILVRGHLTKENLNITNNVWVGDPGLITDRVFSSYLVDNKKEFDVGIVPHYSDWDAPILRDTISRIPQGLKFKIINVKRYPLEVIKDISQCKCILSSSLHGLIVADSLNIPNQWIGIANNLIGNEFKFRDYYSCFDEERNRLDISLFESIPEMMKTTKVIAAEKVDQVKDNIENAFHQFRKELK